MTLGQIKLLFIFLFYFAKLDYITIFSVYKSEQTSAATQYSFIVPD